VRSGSERDCNRCAGELSGNKPANAGEERGRRSDEGRGDETGRPEWGRES